MYRKIEVVEKSHGNIWPKPRSGHRMCADKNFLYVFGGYDPIENNSLYNELWRYNITTGNWINLPDPYGMAPKECASCSMVLWRNKIIIFGGSGYPFAHANSNKLLMYCLNNFAWVDLNYLAQKGIPNHIKEADSLKQKQCGCIKLRYNIPTPKYGQGMAISPDHNLAIFSGTTGRSFSDEFHIFSLNKLRWESLKLCSKDNQDVPTSRYRHETIWTDNEFYVFGGSILHHAFGFDEIHSFHFKELCWKKHKCTSNVFTELSAGHNHYYYPNPRKAHSCVYCNGFVYMIGGVSEYYFQDIWVLDIKKKNWLFSDKWTFPYKVYFHSSAATDNGCLYVFGGINEEGSRTSNLHKMWLQVPSLVEQAWMKITGILKGNECLKRDVLINLGVPKSFWYRINDSCVPAA